MSIVMPPTGEPGGAGELGSPGRGRRGRQRLRAAPPARHRAASRSPAEEPEPACRPTPSRSTARRHHVTAPADEPLLWVLRDMLGVTGPKYGCGVGVCNACTSHLDGRRPNPCITPFSDVRRQERRHDRRARRRRHAPSGAAGLDRRRRRPMRLLPARPDHGRGRAARANPHPTDADIDAIETSAAAAPTVASARRSTAPPA